MNVESSVSRVRHLVSVVFIPRFLCCLAAFQCIAPEEDWMKGSSGISCFVIQHVNKILSFQSFVYVCIYMIKVRKI